MAIKTSQLNAEREHRATAVLSFENEAGDRETETVTVVFRGRSVASTRKLADLSKNVDGYLWDDFLLAYLVRLEDAEGKPAVVDDDGAAVVLTKDILQTWDPDNLKALHDAIFEVINPNPSPSEASQTT